MKDAPLSDMLRQASINNNIQFMAFYDYICQDFLDTGRSTGAYFIFYQGCWIDHNTNVPGPVSQSSAKSEYNATFTAVNSWFFLNKIRRVHFVRNVENCKMHNIVWCEVGLHLDDILTNNVGNNY